MGNLLNLKKFLKKAYRTLGNVPRLQLIISSRGPEGTKNASLRKKSEKFKPLYTLFIAFCLPIL